MDTVYSAGRLATWRWVITQRPELPSALAQLADNDMPQTVPWPTKDQRCLPWCVVFIEKNPVMVIFFMKSIQINWNHGVFFLPLESYACLTLCRDVISAVLGMITTRLQLRSCGDAVPHGDGLDVWQKWLQTCPMIRNGMWLSAHIWHHDIPCFHEYWHKQHPTIHGSCCLTNAPGDTTGLVQTRGLPTCTEPGAIIMGRGTDLMICVWIW